MNAETLKDFLISLGFKVDEAGARKFDAVVAGTTLKAIELGTKVELAAASWWPLPRKSPAVSITCTGPLSAPARRCRASNRLGMRQPDGRQRGRRPRLSRKPARFMRNNPGEGLSEPPGRSDPRCQRQHAGYGDIFTGVGQRLSSMPYYRANQYAQMLGIDENTLMAMRRGIGQFSGEYTAMAKAIGYNADVAAVSSNKFMTSLRSFGLMAGMARDKIGSSLADGLTGSLDRLRRQIWITSRKLKGQSPRRLRASSGLARW
jgi:hypothetical protein